MRQMTLTSCTQRMSFSSRAKLFYIRRMTLRSLGQKAPRSVRDKCSEVWCASGKRSGQSQPRSSTFLHWWTHAFLSEHRLGARSFGKKKSSARNKQRSTDRPLAAPETCPSTVGRGDVFVSVYGSCWKGVYATRKRDAGVFNAEMRLSSRF